MLIRVTALCVLSLAVVACAGSPTAPSGSLGATVPIGTNPLLFDPSLSGSAYILTDVTSSSITVVNNQHPEPITVPYDTSTTFRRAVLQSWQPSDPYYAAAQAYNQSDLTGEGWTSVLQALEGGNVRVVLPPNPIQPGDPYRVVSFQPIP